MQNTGKGKLPGLPFSRMKEHVLGPEYELSLVFVGPKKMQELNKQYRGKDYATDILSFPLTETSGEIFICLSIAKEKAKDFSRKASDHVGFLFIHGLLHLKGLDHGSRMDQEERSISSVFGIDISQ
jgi:probable rRNA maturation factor